MKKVLIIFSWQGDQARIHRHIPYWERSGCDLLFVCPEDAPLHHMLCLPVNKSEKFGRELIRRTVAGLSFALANGADYIYCTEADSICLGTAPDPFADAVGGYVFPDDGTQFRASSFVHWAWSFTRSTLAAVLAHATEDEESELFPDRWLPLVCERAGIPIRHDETLFSRNQFDTPELMAEAREAVKRGVWHIHGVKFESQLKELLA